MFEVVSSRVSFPDLDAGTQEQEQLAAPETINEDDCQIPILSMMLHDPRFIERIGEDRFRDAGHYYRSSRTGRRPRLTSAKPTYAWW